MFSFRAPPLVLTQLDLLSTLPVRADLFLADLAAMRAGVSTDGMRVAGVPVGVDAWVKIFVAKKAQSVITDVAKLDVVSDGLIHTQLLNCCQNARMAFLGRNTPTPLLSEFMVQVDATIVEAVCRHGTGPEEGMWIDSTTSAQIC